MKKALRWLDDNLELSLCVVLMLTMTFLVFAQVIARYVFRNSFSWSEEMARYCFFWLICLGIAYGCKVMKHIKIEAALKLFPSPARPYIVILGDVLFLGFACYVVYTGWLWVQAQAGHGEHSPGLGLPMVWLYIAPSVGFLFAAFRQVQTIVFRWRHRHDEEKEPELEELVS